MPLQSPVIRWSVALALIAASVALNFPLQTLVAGRTPFVVAFPTLMAIAFLCGAAPAVLSLALVTLAFATWWTEPIGTPLVDRATDVWALGIFVCAAGVAIALASITRGLVLQARTTRQRVDMALRAVT